MSVSTPASRGPRARSRRSRSRIDVAPSASTMSSICPAQVAPCQLRSMLLQPLRKQPGNPRKLTDPHNPLRIPKKLPRPECEDPSPSLVPPACRHARQSPCRLQRARARDNGRLINCSCAKRSLPRRKQRIRKQASANEKQALPPIPAAPSVRHLRWRSEPRATPGHLFRSLRAKTQAQHRISQLGSLTNFHFWRVDPQKKRRKGRCQLV